MSGRMRGPWRRAVPTSGKAILLRNPHLAWTAGYYEAHLTVPGVVDFYGDFRIGGPLIVIGGFNKDLGFATTNSNSGDLTEFYALDVDPASADRYLMDGDSLPLKKESFTVEFVDNGKPGHETRDYWSTNVGPVVHRTAQKIYVARTPGDRDYRAGEQFLRMMRAKSLAQWKDAMRIRALITSNYTYADRAGNIFYLWNTALPSLPHVPGGDQATPVRAMGDLWTRYVPLEELPQFLNPLGGYLHNENDSPHFANVRQKINTVNKYPTIEPPSLRLRSQHAIGLLDNQRKFSLESVVRTKHSYKMLLADRVKPDLINAVAATKPSGEVAQALALMGKWDNTAAPASRGGALFEVWWGRYSQGRQPAQQYQPSCGMRRIRCARRAVSPTPHAPLRHSSGLSPRRRRGTAAWTWRGVTFTACGGEPWTSPSADVRGRWAASGCSRSRATTPTASWWRTSGDGWVLAVEFGATVPRAYSVLAYGQSPRPDSPWHADQAAMFAKGELKRVAFTTRDIDAQAVTRYRPGQTQ